MFIASFFLIAKSLEKSKCLSMGEWVNKLWSTNALEYYTEIQRSKVLIYTTNYMDLKCLVLTEGRWTQKTTYCMSPFIRHCRKGKIIGGENRQVVVRTKGWRRGWQQRNRGIFENVFISCLSWWLLECMYLSKIIELYTNKNTFCCKTYFDNCFLYNWFLCISNYFIACI